ncbi:MAG: hypothetical protein IJU76_14905 [Desulfovibrionaceae bacterium]|nr:hypothetical protein [Desulfovibrionaceae bacterium]
MAILTALILLKCSQLVIPLASRFQRTSEQKLELRNRAGGGQPKREDPAGNAAPAHSRLSHETSKIPKKEDAISGHPLLQFEKLIAMSYAPSQ